MSFKYINPGYAELLDAAGGTTVTDSQKSKTGVFFWQPTRSKGINLSEIPTELYGKFDVYLPSGTGLDVWAYVAFCGYCDVQIRGYNREWSVSGYYTGSSYFSNKAQVIYDAVNTIWFNAKPTDVGDCMTVKVNGVEIGKRTGINFNTTSRYIEICSNSSIAIISNLILSDTEIHPREQVVTLPVKTTETTMTANGTAPIQQMPPISRFCSPWMSIPCVRSTERIRRYGGLSLWEIPPTVRRMGLPI